MYNVSDNMTSVYKNPFALPRIGCDAILDGSADGICVEPPGENRIYRLKPPAFHDDPDNARIFSSFAESDIISPPVFTLSLRNASISGFRTVLSQDGFFTNDLGHTTEAEALTFGRYLASASEITGLIPGDSAGVFRLRPELPKVHLDGPVVVLTSAEAGNYGSFIFRELAKLTNFGQIPPTWRFLIHVSTDTFNQFLSLAGVSADRVIFHDVGQIYTVDQAIVPGIRSPLAVIDPAASQFYKKLRQSCAADGHRPRLYIARSVANAARRHGRVMLNEAELVDELRKLDFDILEAENQTAAGQVAAFAAADCVVGASGSGIFNAVFCRPGTVVIDIESEPHWALPIRCLLDSSELHYAIFEAMADDQDWSVHHKPFRVNIPALIERIIGMSTRFS